MAESIAVVGPAWVPPELGRGSTVWAGSARPPARRAAVGRMAGPDTSIEGEQTGSEEQISANRRRRVQDTLAGLTDKRRSASAPRNRPAGPAPTREPSKALPCAWKIPPEPGHPFPGRWRMGGWVLSLRVGQGRFVTKPSRYSKALLPRKGQLHNSGILHNLHIDWKLLQSGLACYNNRREFFLAVR